MNYESPAIDKDGLSERAMVGQIALSKAFTKSKFKNLKSKIGVKYIPHNCPACGEPASVAENGSSFCRNQDCIIKWRFEMPKLIIIEQKYQTTCWIANQILVRDKKFIYFFYITINKELRIEEKK